MARAQSIPHVEPAPRQPVPRAEPSSRAQSASRAESTSHQPAPHAEPTPRAESAPRAEPTPRAQWLPRPQPVSSNQPVLQPQSGVSGPAMPAPAQPSLVKSGNARAATERKSARVAAEPRGQRPLSRIGAVIGVATVLVALAGIAYRSAQQRMQTSREAAVTDTSTPPAARWQGSEAASTSRPGLVSGSESGSGSGSGPTSKSAPGSALNSAPAAAPGSALNSG